MRPRGPQLSSALIVGDYVQVAAERFSANGRGLDEGFARIEWIEHVPADTSLDMFTDRNATWSPVPVAWCHGVPGPLVLDDGDVRVLDYWPDPEN